MWALFFVCAGLSLWVICFNDMCESLEREQRVRPRDD
jgi:hypothetical protein